jgi:prepilin-type processing-associated H-X9-DG protein
MQVSVTNGGTMELVATGNVVATFQVMSNELSTPKVVVCPQDLSRNYAANFTTDFNNSRISYFIGVDANDNFPQSVLSGDANFEIGGIPTKYGLLELSTNLNVAWTSARHFVGGSQFWKPTWHKSFGNFVFADGSVWSMDDKLLVQKLIETGLATNRLAIP